MASAQHGLVTRTQLDELGYLRGAIARRVASGRLRRLHRGVYAVSRVALPLEREMAAVLACGPVAVLSHRSAAALFGLIPAADDSPVDVTVPLPFDRTRPGVRVRRTLRLDPDERTRHDGIPITTAQRTLVDLAGITGESVLERALARAERERLVRPGELTALCARYGARPGIARMRAILERAGGPSLTRSEAESRFLALVRRARLPAPVTNAHVAEYEIDFLWPANGLAVEIDGFRYHSSRPRFEGDRRRVAHLASLGIRVVPLTWRQVVDDEVATAVQIGQALLRTRP